MCFCTLTAEHGTAGGHEMTCAQLPTTSSHVTVSFCCARRSSSPSVDPYSARSSSTKRGGRAHGPTTCEARRGGARRLHLLSPTEDLRVLTLYRIDFELDGVTAFIGWPSGLAICDDWRAMLDVIRRHAGQARLADIVCPCRAAWPLQPLPVAEPATMEPTLWKQSDALLRGYRCTTYKQSQRPQWGFTFSLNTKPVKQRTVSVSPPAPELVELCSKNKTGIEVVVLMHPGGRAWYCFKASTDLTAVDDDD